MKIIIIGAGIGGLSMASLLSRDKHDVILYEAKREQDIGYEWYDNISTNDLKKWGFDYLIPSKLFKEDKRLVISPSEKSFIAFQNNRPGDYEQVYRQDVIQKLLEKAINNANVLFNQNVQDIVLDNGRVIGIKVNNELICADLVINCAGLTNFPSQKDLTVDSIEDKDILYAYRGIFKRKNKTESDYQNKIYIRHLGQLGIAWYNVNSNNEIDILIGRIGRIDEEDINEALKRIIDSNDDHIDFEESPLYYGVYKIPVRYPSLMMIQEGYITIGDSAYMTIPMIGSGILNTLIASKILSDKINNADKASMDLLWSFQRDYYMLGMKNCFSIDALKRWLINADIEKVEQTFSNKIINGKDISNILCGDFIDFDLKSIFEKIRAGVTNPILLLELGSIVLKGLQSEKLAKTIPKDYDLDSINKWHKRLRKVVK